MPLSSIIFNLENKSWFEVSKSLGLTKLPLRIVEHVYIKLVLIWKLHPYCPVFIVLGRDCACLKGKCNHSLQAVNPASLNDLHCKICSQQSTEAQTAREYPTAFWLDLRFAAIMLLMECKQCKADIQRYFYNHRVVYLSILLKEAYLCSRKTLTRIWRLWRSFPIL